MSCTQPFDIRYADRIHYGLKAVTCLGDGASVLIEWHKAFLLKTLLWGIVYNIYYSTNQSTVFSEGVKLVSKNTNLSAIIKGGFKPGDVYYFAVRAGVHENETFNIDSLPTENGLYIYSESVLRQNIQAEDLIIPLVDVSGFPGTGVIILGRELVKYSSVDTVNNNLIVLEGDRGYLGYEPTQHTVDGYNGESYLDPSVKIWKGYEDVGNAIGFTEIKFQEQYARTDTDGYKERVDIVTSEKSLDVVNDENNGFPSYDLSGYDRTYLGDYLSGKCVGTYFGGEYGCADGEDTDGTIRGLSVQDHMNMREEYLLELTGDFVVLFKRKWEGKQSMHYDSTRENTAYRGIDNFGTPVINGYEQYYNPRRADGRILVRFGPTREDIKREETGLENEFIPNCWTLVIPGINDGDFFIRYNSDGTEEWRYEIINVERNKVLLQETGRQTFTAVRVRNRS